MPRVNWKAIELPIFMFLLGIMYMAASIVPPVVSYGILRSEYELGVVILVPYSLAVVGWNMLVYKVMKAQFRKKRNVKKV